jgi:hypothetical protein
MIVADDKCAYDRGSSVIRTLVVGNDLESKTWPYARIDLSARMVQVKFFLLHLFSN